MVLLSLFHPHNDNARLFVFLSLTNRLVNGQDFFPA